MRWQQIVIIVLTAMDLGLALALHGKPKEGNFNFWTQLLADAVIIFLLASGGFFR